MKLPGLTASHGLDAVAGWYRSPTAGGVPGAPPRDGFALVCDCGWGGPPRSYSSTVSLGQTPRPAPGPGPSATLESGLYMAFVDDDGAARLAWTASVGEAWTVLEGSIAEDVVAPPTLLAIGSGQLALAYVQTEGNDAKLTLATTTDGVHWTTTPVVTANDSPGQFSAGLGLCLGQLYICYPSFKDKKTGDGVTDKGYPTLERWSDGQLTPIDLPNVGSLNANRNVNENWGGAALVSGDDNLLVVFPESSVSRNELNYYVGNMSSSVDWKSTHVHMKNSSGTTLHGSGRPTGVIVEGTTYLATCSHTSERSTSNGYTKYKIRVLSGNPDSRWSDVGPANLPEVGVTDVSTMDSRIYMSPALTSDGSSLIFAYRQPDGGLALYDSDSIPPSEWTEVDTEDFPTMNHDPALTYLR